MESLLFLHFKYENWNKFEYYEIMFMFLLLGNRVTEVQVNFLSDLKISFEVQKFENRTLSF